MVVGDFLWYDDLGLGLFYPFPSIQPNTWKGVTTVEVDGESVPWTSANELNSQLQANNRVFTENFEQNILENAGASEATVVLAKLNDLQSQRKLAKKMPNYKHRLMNKSNCWHLMLISWHQIQKHKNR